MFLFFFARYIIKCYEQEFHVCYLHPRTTKTHRKSLAHHRSAYLAKQRRLQYAASHSISDAPLPLPLKITCSERSRTRCDRGCTVAEKHSRPQLQSGVSSSRSISVMGSVRGEYGNRLAATTRAAHSHSCGTPMASRWASWAVADSSMVRAANGLPDRSMVLKLLQLMVLGSEDSLLLDRCRNLYQMIGSSLFNRHVLVSRILLQSPHSSHRKRQPLDRIVVQLQHRQLSHLHQSEWKPR